jgi:hypothetical protein
VSGPEIASISISAPWSTSNRCGTSTTSTPRAIAHQRSTTASEFRLALVRELTVEGPFRLMSTRAGSCRDGAAEQAFRVNPPTPPGLTHL